jgi:hypothetical protein
MQLLLSVHSALKGIGADIHMKTAAKSSPVIFYLVTLNVIINYLSKIKQKTLNANQGTQ